MDDCIRRYFHRGYSDKDIVVLVEMTTDDEVFFSNPAYQTECIDYLTKASREKFSLFVSELIDRLGYSYDMIKYRQHMNAEIDTVSNRHENLTMTSVQTGGKGEGSSLYYESDFDHMFIVNDVICADNPQRFIQQENITLFQTERHETSPGYTRLKLLKQEGKRFVNDIRQSLFESETGSYYLSSQFFNDMSMIDLREPIAMYKIEMEAPSGPSTPVSYMNHSHDLVTCFRCFCPDILDRWVSRPRYNGWPSQDSIHEISRLDGHVVPVGCKGSENMYKEWRICYSLAELYLMRNLNETQIKVYIILKNLCKSVLKPVCEDMTSYIMKNVVLWVCEANGVARYKSNVLKDRLLDCIKYLRVCVSENNLPSYMIPERNLLAGRLDIQQRQRLASLLSDLLHEGGRLLLRCEKLRDAMLVMYKTPDMFREFGEKRDKVESLVMMRRRIRAETRRPEISEKERKQRLRHNEQHCDIQTHIEHLIKFDVQALRQTGKTPEEINDLWQKRLIQLLS